MIPLLFAALAGGVVMASVAAPLGALSAVLAAPLGASVCTLLAAFYLARQRGSERQTPIGLDDQTDAMVSALRDLSGQAKLDADADAGPSRDTDRVRAA